MDLTAATRWLNSAFAGFDAAVSGFAYRLHQGGLGGFLDRFFAVFTRLGDKGLIFIVIALVLLCFKRTRKRGAAVLCAMLIGMLVTNICVKNLVARPRPYSWEESAFHIWWLELGHGIESEFSFPSGHSTVSFAAMGALFLYGDGKKRYLLFIPALLMAFSRIYLFVHYPSDILGGMAAGLISAFAAHLLIESFARRHKRVWAFFNNLPLGG